MIIPGVQKPHCSPPVSAKASWRGWSLPFCSRPSIVVTSLPRTAFTGTWHDLTASLPTTTVQAPQRLSPHPNFVPVRPRSVRRTHRSVRSPSTYRWLGLPLSRNEMESFIGFLAVSEMLRRTRTPPVATFASAPHVGQNRCPVFFPRIAGRDGYSANPGMHLLHLPVRPLCPQLEPISAASRVRAAPNRSVELEVEAVALRDRLAGRNVIRRGGDELGGLGLANLGERRGELRGSDSQGKNGSGDEHQTHQHPQQSVLRFVLRLRLFVSHVVLLSSDHERDESKDEASGHTERRRSASLCFRRVFSGGAPEGGAGRPFRGRQFLIPGHDDAVLADLLVERAARNTKRFRSAADPSVLGLDRLADQVLLRLEETAISSSRRRGGRGRGLEGKLLRPDLQPVR